MVLFLYIHYDVFTPTVISLVELTFDISFMGLTLLLWIVGEVPLSLLPLPLANRLFLGSLHFSYGCIVNSDEKRVLTMESNLVDPVSSNRGTGRTGVGDTTGTTMVPSTRVVTTVHTAVSVS